MGDRQRRGISQGRARDTAGAAQSSPDELADIAGDRRGGRRRLEASGLEGSASDRGSECRRRPRAWRPASIGHPRCLRPAWHRQDDDQDVARRASQGHRGTMGRLRQEGSADHRSAVVPPAQGLSPGPRHQVAQHAPGRHSWPRQGLPQDGLRGRLCILSFRCSGQNTVSNRYTATNQCFQ